MSHIMLVENVDLSQDAELAVLIDFLRSGVRIRNLDLDGCNLTTAGLETVFSVWVSPKILAQQFLTAAASGHRLGVLRRLPPELWFVVYQQLLATPWRPPPLEGFTLRNNHVSLQGSAAICDFLQAWPTLIFLRLQQVDLNDAKLQVLLQARFTLRYLSLDHNRIGDAGATALAAFIMNAHVRGRLRLAHVDLKWNYIEDEGAYALRTALDTTSSLHALNLAWNSLSHNGRRMFGSGYPYGDGDTMVTVGEQRGDDVF